MTIAERRLLRICRAKAQETMPKHYAEEPFTWNGYGGEVTAYPCACGQSFTEETECEQHIEEEA